MCICVNEKERITHTHTHTHIYIYTHTSKGKLKSLSVWIHKYINVGMRKRITHTHTHTHTQILLKQSSDPSNLPCWHSSKFHEGSRVRQTPEEGRGTYRPKRCGNNNKDEDNSPKTLNDKNYLRYEIMKISGGRYFRSSSEWELWI